MQPLFQVEVGRQVEIVQHAARTDMSAGDHALNIGLVQQGKIDHLGR